MTIAERAAAARAEETAGLLRELFVSRDSTFNREQLRAFYALETLNTPESLLAAAMMLLPDGWGLTITRYWISESDEPVWSAELASGGLPANPRKVFDCYDTPSPAPALIAAIAASKGV